MLVVAVCLFLAPGFAAPRAWLKARLRGANRVALCLILFILPYLVYCAGTDPVACFAKLFGLAAVPFGLFAIAPVRNPKGMNWQDVVVLLWLMLPVLAGRLRGDLDKPVNLGFHGAVVAGGSRIMELLIGRTGRYGYEFGFTNPRLRRGGLIITGLSDTGGAARPSNSFHLVESTLARIARVGFRLRDRVAAVAAHREVVFRELIQNLLEGSLPSRSALKGLRRTFWTQYTSLPCPLSELALCGTSHESGMVLRLGVSVASEPDGIGSDPRLGG